jgi:hypothetical protein
MQQIGARPGSALTDRPAWHTDQRAPGRIRAEKKREHERNAGQEGAICLGSADAAASIRLAASHAFVFGKLL